MLAVAVCAGDGRGEHVRRDRRLVDDLDASARERLGFTGRVPVLTTVWRLLLHVDAETLTAVLADRLCSRLSSPCAQVPVGDQHRDTGHGRREAPWASGDETAAMAAHLTGQLGVDPRRVVADPHGLDTYDSCLRAREVYGVERALIVTQSYHLSRAVTLCRALGIDADGVPARCSGCGSALLREKAIRDYFASGKAAWDVISRRSPAVDSPPHSGVTDALSG